jgi:hypothetical protein
MIPRQSMNGLMRRKRLGPRVDMVVSLPSQTSGDSSSRIFRISYEKDLCIQPPSNYNLLNSMNSRHFKNHKSERCSRRCCDSVHLGSG